MACNPAVQPTTRPEEWHTLPPSREQAQSRAATRTWLNPSSFTKTFDRLVETSGLPRIRLHDLRHTHASIGLAANVHPKVMQDRLGHSTIAITMDIYSHVIPSQDAAAAQLIAARVADGTPAPFP